MEQLIHRVRRSRVEPEGALVLFHGRGADESDLLPLLDLLDPEQRLVGVCPRGPLSLPPGGAHWYMVERVGFPDPSTFHSSFELVSDWLNSVSERTALPLDRIVLGGFSQGAVMACSLGLGRGRPPPAGLIMLSGFLPRVQGFDLEPAAARGLPIAIGHGLYDPVIGVEFGHEARRRLEAADAEVLYQESPMPHSIDPAFIDALAPWLQGVLGSRRKLSPERAPPPTA